MENINALENARLLQEVIERTQVAIEAMRDRLEEDLT